MVCAMWAAFQNILVLEFAVMAETPPEPTFSEGTLATSADTPNENDDGEVDHAVTSDGRDGVRDASELPVRPTNESEVSQEEPPPLAERPPAPEGGKKQKKPRKILHFSDGVLEEYSTSEDEGLEDVTVGTVAQKHMAVDKAQMAWGTWMWFVTTSSLNRVLAACDYAGETLASFFRITTPKYQYEYNEYQRMLEEEKQREIKLKEQMAGWKTDGEGTADSTAMNTPVVSTEDVRVTAIEGNTRKPNTRPQSDKWERY